ncbi:hypothetical protein DFH06DRAFT_429421 [Mycena polygramma]|nr:hypothetical protein DFH06DRAFT_429421 [Mycena polygramma]
MFTVFQTITFLKVYIGDALSRFLSLFARRGVKECDVEVGDLSSDAEARSTDSSVLYNDVVALVPASAPEVEYTPTEPEKDVRTGPELFSAAVAADLCSLPSLPSVLKSPKARLPPQTAPSHSERQDFGTPSNLFYEHRLPLGNVSNLPRFGGEQKGMRLDSFQVKPLAPRKGKSKSRAKKSRPVQIPLIVVVDTAVQEPSATAAESVTVLKPIAAPVPESVAAPVIVKSSVAAPESVPAPVRKFVASPIPAPVLACEARNAAPGSVEWENKKAAVLAQAQTFSDQVKASRRISPPAPAPIPVPAPVNSLVLRPPKRHSAPPVLCAPRKSLQDRLSALLAATTDTIAALDKDSEKIDQSKKGEMRIKNGGVPEIGEVLKEARRFSAVALEEGREVFSIGEDPDDEDEDDTPLGELFEARRRRNDSIV